MKRRITIGSAGLFVTAAALFVAFTLIGPTNMLAQVAARVRRVKTYSCRASMTLAKPSDAGRPKEHLARYYWQAPGSIRIETFEDDRLVETDIHPAGKAGMKIYHAKESYAYVVPRNFRAGRWSPGHWITKLANYSGEPDVDLGTKEISGRNAHGFQVATSKGDPDFPMPGVMRIWADKETRLPVLFEIEIEVVSEEVTVRFDEFQWDVTLNDDLFQVTAPQDYADKTPPAKTDKEKEQHLVQAFRAYAEIMGGHYPKVGIIYGDVPYDQMRAKAGIPRDAAKLTEEQIKSKAYVNLLKSAWGWNLAHQILRDNPDAAYYGKTVGPEDEGKVLFRWRVDDGRFRVLYGDLRFETVSAERLRELEKTQ